MLCEQSTIWDPFGSFHVGWLRSRCSLSIRTHLPQGFGRCRCYVRFLDLSSEASSANILLNVVCEVGCIIRLASHFFGHIGRVVGGFSSFFLQNEEGQNHKYFICIYLHINLLRGLFMARFINTLGVGVWELGRRFNSHLSWWVGDFWYLDLEELEVHYKRVSM